MKEDMQVRQAHRQAGKAGRQADMQGRYAGRQAGGQVRQPSKAVVVLLTGRLLFRASKGSVVPL